jgi:hypothetical protein
MRASLVVNVDEIDRRPEVVELRFLWKSGTGFAKILQISGSNELRE